MIQQLTNFLTRLLLDPVIAIGIWMLEQETVRTAILSGLGVSCLGVAILWFSHRKVTTAFFLTSLALGSFGQAFADPKSPKPALVFYGLSLCCLVPFMVMRLRNQAPLLRSESPTDSPLPQLAQRMDSGATLRKVVILSGFIFAGLVLLYRLDEISPRVGDYAASGALVTCKALQGTWPKAKTFWQLTPGTMLHTFQSPIYILTQYLSFRLNGPNLYGVRFNDALWTLTGLLFFYHLLRREWNRAIALTGVIVLTGCRFFQVFSRTGTYLGATVTWSMILLFVMQKIIRRPTGLAYASMGALLAGASYFYTPIRFMVLFCLSIIGLNSITNRTRRVTAIRNLLIMVGTGLLCALPQVWQAKSLRNTYFFERADSPPDVPIWKKSADGLKITNEFSWEALQANFRRNFREVVSLIYIRGAFSDYFAVLLVPGLVLLLTDRQRLFAVILGLWGIWSLLPAVLVNPESRRYLLVTPVLATGIVLGIAVVWQESQGVFRSRALRSVAQVWLISLLVPLYLMDLGGFYTGIRGAIHRDWAYGHTERERLGWLTRELVSSFPVVLPNAGVNQATVEFLLFEESSFKAPTSRHRFLSESDFLALIHEGSADHVYALLADARWSFAPTGWPRSGILGEALASAYRHWPEAQVLEGRWLVAPTKTAFGLIIPPNHKLPPLDLTYFRWGPIRVTTVRELIEELQANNP